MKQDHSFHIAGAMCVLSMMILAGCESLSFGERIEQHAASGADVVPALPVAAAVEHIIQPVLTTSRFELTSADQRVVGEVQVIRTRADDTFVDIARTYNLGYDELLQANPGVDPWLPGEGSEVVLPTRFILPEAPREGIVINTAQMRLYYYPEAADGELQVVYTHPIGIGRLGWATPTGESKVIGKAVDPTWYPPASVRRDHAERGNPLPSVVPPGPDNPLGRHVFRLDLPSYLIHGTNLPPGVGMRSSAGCVRMYPEDIEALYPKVVLGTRVTLVDQPITAAWHDGQLYVDAHPLLEEDERDVAQLVVDTLERAVEAAGQALGSVDFRRAAALLEEGHGVPMPSLRSSVGSAAYLSRARRVENMVGRDSDSDPELAAVSADADDAG